MRSRNGTLAIVVIVGAALLGVMAAFSLGGLAHAPQAPAPSPGGEIAQPQEPAKGALAPRTLELNEKEIDRFKILAAEARTFSVQREAVGNIDFNQEMSMDVFPPVAGKILRLFSSAGDDVRQGEPLYTIDSPDLVQAASNLIAAAGILELTTKALVRAQELRAVKGNSERDLEQALSDQQTAEASLKAARDAVRIFGKTDGEMDALITRRKIDPELVVPTPITGRVIARNAAPGLLVQPGAQPAPYTLSDVSTLWMLADVAESEFALLKLGQSIDVRVKAYPDKTFCGKLVNIGAAVDPGSRRLTVRSIIQDPQHELRPGMFATFIIRIGESRTVGVPLNGVIREGDGTMTVWVTADRKSLVQKTVKIGVQQDGWVQILEGVAPGELVATDAALFLSNALTTSK